MTTLQTMYAPQANSPSTATTGAMTTGQTTVNVLDASVLPAAPNLLVFGADKTSPETVLMTDKTGNTLTITRAVQGVAQSWGANTVVGRYFTATDLSTVQENIQTLNADKVDEADLATVATSGSYDDLEDVPESFTPSTHTHTKSQVTDFPSSMTPTAHKSTHASGGGDALSPADIGAAEKSLATTATILAESWTGSSAPFSYTLSVAGVTTTSVQEILPSLTITAAELESLQAANVQDGGQTAGQITLKAFGDKPTIDLPVRIVLRGDL